MNKMYWKGRIRKMKKIFKKVIATVAAFAFVAAGLVAAPKTAKAAGWAAGSAPQPLTGLPEICIRRKCLTRYTEYSHLRETGYPTLL